MIESLSLSVARTIKRAYPPADLEIMAYEIGRKLNFWSIVILTLLLSWLFTNVVLSTLSMVAFGFIRYWSGGKHFDLTTCMIVSVSIFVLSPVIDLTATSIYLLSLFSGMIFFVHTRSRKRLYSMSLILLSVLTASSVLVITFAAQAILLMWEEDENEYQKAS